MKKVRGMAGAGVLLAIFGAFALMVFVLLAVAMFGTNNLDDSSSTTTTSGSTLCGEGVETLVPGFKMLPQTKGKLGSEDHMTSLYDKTACFIKGNKHYEGTDSGNLTNPGSYTLNGSDDGTCGSFPPRTTDQERWYFNARWGGWLANGNLLDTRKGAAEARKKVKHSKLIITSVESKQSMIVSAEEYGPADWVTARDGIAYGAPPEVRNYLKTSGAYTGNPNDGKGEITVLFAKDQNAKLGPCKIDQGIGGPMKSEEK